MRAALGAALFMAGVGVGACGAQSQSPAASSGSAGSQTSTTGPTGTGGTDSAAASGSTSTSGTVTTVGSFTHTVVGSTPSGQTVTETSTNVVTQAAGPDGIALQGGTPLGSTNTTVTGQSINGIQCDRENQLAYQTAAHLLVYVDGQPRALPGAIGMVNPHASISAGTTTTYSQGLCAYWVRTRAANGLIQVDSPTPQTFTLGDLFAIWDEPLSGEEVAASRGPVTALVNGRRWHGDPSAIPLREHDAIQLAVGRPVPPFQPVSWSQTDL